MLHHFLRDKEIPKIKNEVEYIRKIIVLHSKNDDNKKAPNLK